MELWRRLRLRRKAILQRAKAKKWQAIGYTVNRFFAALRYQLRLTIRWFRRIHIANPGLLRRLANRATRKFSFLLAFVFLALTILGITAQRPFIWTIAPLGVVLSLVAPMFFSPGFFARLGRLAILCLATLWAGSWIIFCLA